jgi:hypothetical protein
MLIVAPKMHLIRMKAENYHLQGQWITQNSIKKREPLFGRYTVIPNQGVGGNGEYFPLITIKLTVLINIFQRNDKKR